MSFFPSVAQIKQKNELLLLTGNFNLLNSIKIYYHLRVRKNVQTSWIVPTVF